MLWWLDGWSDESTNWQAGATCSLAAIQFNRGEGGTDSVAAGILNMLLAILARNYEGLLTRRHDTRSTTSTTTFTYTTREEGQK